MATVLTLRELFTDPITHLEALASLATIAQFFVVLVTAVISTVTIILGYRQLRHSQHSNQFAALKALDHATQNETFISAQEKVATELVFAIQSPEFRYQVVHYDEASTDSRKLIAAAFTIGNFYEHLGRLVKHDLIDANLILESWSPAIIGDWAHLSDLIQVKRRTAGKVLWENFEALSVQAEAWMATHRDGNVNPGVLRTDLKDRWKAADAAYEAGRF